MTYSTEQGANPMTDTRADRMRHNARLVDKQADEAQRQSLAAEDLLTRLEDRDARRRQRTQAAVARMGMQR